MDLIPFRFGETYLPLSLLYRCKRIAIVFADGNCYSACFLLVAVTITFRKILTICDLGLLPRSVYDCDFSGFCQEVCTILGNFDFSENCVRFLKIFAY